jgi:hypothetical protein
MDDRRQRAQPKQLRGPSIMCRQSPVYGPACPAARAEHIEPRRSGDQRGPNGGRPQHVAAGGQAPIPAVDDERCLKARGRNTRSRKTGELLFYCSGSREIAVLRASTMLCSP